MFIRILVVCFHLLLLFGCDQVSGEKIVDKIVTDEMPEINDTHKPINKNTQANPPIMPEKKEPVSYQEIEWTELMPSDDLDALLNPPEYIMNVIDGSSEDQISSKMNAAQRDESALMSMNILDTLSEEQLNEINYNKALMSTDIIKEMDGENIEIPGFIVPVEFDDNQIVTSFFLVPYYGACLHMPPPPPNQIIYIELEDGFALAELYDPVVVSGKLSVKLIKDEIATSAYTMIMDKIRLYYENE